MKLADSLSFVPMALAVTVAISLPNAQDQAKVAEVRATLSSVVASATGLLGGTPDAPVTVRVADASREVSQHWGSTYPESHGSKAKAQQTWENRPSGRDYSNGRAVRMTYGESQRDLGAHRR